LIFPKTEGILFANKNKFKRRVEMTREQTFALKPGEELAWAKPPSEVGVYDHEAFASDYGAIVKFKSYAQGNKYSFRDQKIGGSLVAFDMCSFPILLVETKKGELRISSRFFE
jgi:hypothetical protein